MLNKRVQRVLIIPTLLLLVGAVLLSCSPTTAETPLTQTETISPTTSTSPPATATITQEGPTPTIDQNLVILVTGPGSDLGLTDQLSLALTHLASTEDLDFELRSSFSQGDSTDAIRLLAAVPPDPGLEELARSAPGTRFLGISIPDLQPSSNLTVIQDQESPPDEIGFLAGYLAAVVTPEWRVGVISSSDSSAGLSQRQGFINGVKFFCGLCRQTYPPYNDYPLFAEAPAASSPSEWLSLADTLINAEVETVYIPPGIGDDSLYTYLAEAGVNLIGTTSPVTSTESSWIASITTDPTSVVIENWPQILAGGNSLNLSAPLTFSYINYDLFSPGRQQLVDKFLTEFRAGFIDTGLASLPDSE
jgi:hypothetical protein